MVSAVSHIFDAYLFLVPYKLLLMLYIHTQPDTWYSSHSFLIWRASGGTDVVVGTYLGLSAIIFYFLDIEDSLVFGFAHQL